MSAELRVRTHYRRWPGSVGEGGWAGERRRAGQAARSRCSTPPAAFPGRPPFGWLLAAAAQDELRLRRSGGLSFAARTASLVGHDVSNIAPSSLLAGQQMPTRHGGLR